MANKKTVKIGDLTQLTRPVSISEDEQILVRPLTLKEMVSLFFDSRDAFLALYQAGVEGATPESLAPFLLTAPELVAKIIAIASDDPGSAKSVENHLPGTVQLIALHEVWQ
ncbi:MAG: hypothetical protein C5B54_05775, partial [Acidobacteria bacterium]